jgi:hypothetical protein
MPHRSPQRFPHDGLGQELPEDVLSALVGLTSIIGESLTRVPTLQVGRPELQSIPS